MGLEGIGLRPFNEDEFRQRIPKFTDEKPIEYGHACKWTCPYPDRDDGDRQARGNMAIHLRLCREEWRYALPTPGRVGQAFRRVFTTGWSA
jgi:hypothetical protein